MGTHGMFRRTLPGAVNAKGACYIYGSADEGIDTSVFIEGEGVLFIGRVALEEMAAVMGYTLHEEARTVQLEEDNAFLQHRIDELEEQVAALEADLETFGRAIAQAARVKAADA
jgi:hypothetical protein